MINLPHENERIAYIIDLNHLENGCISIASILNKNGSGDLYIGVEKNGKIIGLSPLKSDVFDMINETIQKYISPKIYPSISYEEKINSIKISFTGNNKPYSSNGVYYIRSYDENRQMDLDSLMNEIKFLNPNHFYEQSKSSESIRDIDDILINDLNARVGVNASRRTLKDNFKKLKLTRDNSLTLAGRMLISKRQPLDIQINVYEDQKRRKITKSILLKGNIFQLLDKVSRFIEEEQTKTKETKKLINDLINETMIFMFLNSSYNVKQPFVISISPFEITFKYPGTLFYMNNLDEYFSGIHYIKNNNPIISNVFRIVKMSSDSKKCLDKIGSICKQNNIIFTSSTTEDTVTITYFRNNGKAISIEDAILSILSTRPTIKADDVAKKLNRTRRTIQTSIKKLKESNLITRKGSNKNGYWIVNK